MKDRMRAWLAAALLSVLFAGAIKAWADVNVQGGTIGSTTTPIKTVVFTTDTSNSGTFTAGNFILGFKLIANTGTGACTLYDSTTLSGTVIDELSEATTGESNTQIWPSPYKLINGLSVDVTTATCIVYYY